MRNGHNLPVISLILFFISPFFSSFEFWLDPGRFQYEQGEEITIRFRVGDNFEGENWEGTREVISSLHLFYGGVNDDLSLLVGNSPGDSLSFSMLDAGTVMIAFENIPATIVTDPEKFNHLLSDYGLADVISSGQSNNESGIAVREIIHRSAKTLIQVGDRKDKTFSLATGMQTDILPVENPFSLNNDDKLSVKIIFRDSVLKNSRVSIWHRDQDQINKTELQTDENGMISFPVKTSGTWMISTLVIEKIFNDPESQWKSFRGSLTWGYDSDKFPAE